MQDTTSVLTAPPNAWMKVFRGRYAEWSIRRSFSQVLLGGEHHHVDLWRKGLATEPLILYCTHVGWWDAAMTIYLSLRVFEFDAYHMTEAEGRAPTGTTIEQASSVLQGTGRVLWMFPQGEQRPQEVRPVHLRPDLALLLRALGSAWFAPVVFRYDVLHGRLPRAVINVGAAERLLWTGHSTVEHTTKLFEQRLTTLADDVEADARMESFHGYHVLIDRGAPSQH